jgi:streptomycin 6-kinase
LAGFRRVVTLPLMFSHYLERLRLTPDGDPIITRSSRLLPVCRDGVPAMLKVAIDAEESLGGRLMAWWDGQGAARVLAHEGDAILMERAENGVSLAELARSDRDDEATRIICAAVARLHVPRPLPPPDLVSLTQWFEALKPAAEAQGGILRLSAAIASELLATQQDMMVLHGDIHHGNVLHFGRRGWLAIDPKGLYGERGFDYANLFCNPDQETATSRLARRVELVAEAAALDRHRLLQWIVAWAGLSASWLLDDGVSPERPLEVAERAAAELRR